MNHLLKLLARNRSRGRFEVAKAADEAEDSATIYLYDAIVDSDEDAYWYGGVSAESVVKTLHHMKAQTIHLHVNSPGGSVFGGRAIEQAIRSYKGEVIAHVDGLAASAASFLIMSAGRVLMAPGAFLMIHNSWTFALGNAPELRKTADLLDQIDSSLVQTYATRTGVEPDEIASMMAAETWIGADDAVRMKFADAIDAGDVDAKARIDWDLSCYAKAPRIVTKAPPASPPPEADREALQRRALKAMIPA